MMIAIGTMGIALADISIQEPVEKLCDSVTANMVTLIVKDFMCGCSKFCCVE
jgi:hypothetical protein